MIAVPAYCAKTGRLVNCDVMSVALHNGHTAFDAGTLRMTTCHEGAFSAACVTSSSQP